MDGTHDGVIDIQNQEGNISQLLSCGHQSKSFAKDLIFQNAKSSEENEETDQYKEEVFLKVKKVIDGMEEGELESDKVLVDQQDDWVFNKLLFKISQDLFFNFFYIIGMYSIVLVFHQELSFHSEIIAGKWG